MNRYLAGLIGGVGKSLQQIGQDGREVVMAQQKAAIDEARAIRMAELQDQLASKRDEVNNKRQDERLDRQFKNNLDLEDRKFSNRKEEISLLGNENRETAKVTAQYGGAYYDKELGRWVKPKDSNTLSNDRIIASTTVSALTEQYKEQQKVVANAPSSKREAEQKKLDSIGQRLNTALDDLNSLSSKNQGYEGSGKSNPKSGSSNSGSGKLMPLTDPATVDMGEARNLPMDGPVPTAINPERAAQLRAINPSEFLMNLK